MGAPVGAGAVGAAGVSETKDGAPGEKTSPNGSDEGVDPAPFAISTADGFVTSSVWYAHASPTGSIIPTPRSLNAPRTMFNVTGYGISPAPGCWVTMVRPSGEHSITATR